MPDGRSEPTIVVCTVGGWWEPFKLPASTSLETTWISGGVRVLYEIAAGLVELGHRVELRGDLDRRVVEEIRVACGHAPETDLEPRRPTRDDVVIVPEGWVDPDPYAWVSLSPARLIMAVLAPPGLWGWPFVEPWTPPDPLTVAVDAVGRAEHYRAIWGSGFELWANSPTVASEAAAAGVPCRMIPEGWPVQLPPIPDKTVDVAVISDNRWAPLAAEVLKHVDVTVDEIPPVDHATLLRRLGQARILLWPSRIEGDSRIQIEARAMGTVPVALRSNRYALTAGLSEEGGAVVVAEIEDLGPAIEALLRDPRRLEALASRAAASARDQVDWGAHLRRLEDAIRIPAVRPDGDDRRTRFGEALTRFVESNDAKGEWALGLERELAGIRQRRSVRWADRLATLVRFHRGTAGHAQESMRRKEGT